MLRCFFWVCNSEVYETVLMAQENIFRYGQAGQSSQLLYDDGYALFIGFHLVLRMNFFSIQYEGTAVDAVDAGQHVGQCGFTGSVLTNQRVNLAFIYIK